ncbi:EEF1A lysine methyltransferase 3 [Larimichthys crocea]|uniref:EEF1A lysine methyltransferase 3 n=1 Tax=Larimichthys crocea TaxID=215358 RepID=UPI000F5E0653|nr:EEF1A lysine methyltransferase 3 [Larimichthys crocea]
MIRLPKKNRTSHHCTLIPVMGHLTRNLRQHFKIKAYTQNTEVAVFGDGFAIPNNNLPTMINSGDEDDPFPVDDCLFAETFSQETVYRLLGEELKIRQLFGANLGVAAPVWDAALHLCCYFEEQSVQLRGKRIIELGAGTGVVGILAARLGAVVTLTDLPLALSQLQANVCANTPSSGWPTSVPTVLPLSWGEDHVNFPSDWDLVLCADIIYLPDTYPLLIETLVHLCKNGAVLYLSSKMRKEHRTACFYEEFLPSRFNVELVKRDDKQNINIYRASLRKEQ